MTNRSRTLQRFTICLLLTLAVSTAGGDGDNDSNTNPVEPHVPFYQPFTNLLSTFKNPFAQPQEETIQSSKIQESLSTASQKHITISPPSGPSFKAKAPSTFTIAVQNSDEEEEDPSLINAIEITEPTPYKTKHLSDLVQVTGKYYKNPKLQEKIKSSFKYYLLIKGQKVNNDIVSRTMNKTKKNREPEVIVYESDIIESNRSKTQFGPIKPDYSVV